MPKFIQFKLTSSFKVILLASLLIYSCKQQKSEPYPIDIASSSENGMVVSAHPLASEIGVNIMKMGGNAIDAMVATQFALAVVYPRAGNIGGGGFMVIRQPDGKSFALDYREKAPEAAYEKMYQDEASEVIDSLSLYGQLSVGVPGSVAGMIKAWRKFGKIKDFSVLMDPAIKLAENGYQINSDQARRLNKYKSDFDKYNDHTIPFLKDEEWKLNDQLIQSDLAKTLMAIRENGIGGFYKGWVAEKIDSQMRAHGGILRQEDLRKYNAVWREPVKVDYNEYTMISMPPPSSGGIVLGQLLKMLAGFDLKSKDLHSVESIHLLTEVEKRAYADRASHMGDIDFYPVPVEQLLDSVYLKHKMADFDPQAASPSRAVKAGEFERMQESMETTHTSIVDADGMAVSATTTLNSNYGSKVMVDGCGFFLNNEMDDFSIKPGTANQFGLVGGKANAIEPGKRMLSSMTPTIFDRNSELFLVLGSPGGSQIITSVLQVFLQVAEQGLTVADAVKAPRFHHQWLPDKIQMEANGFDPEIIQQLESLGHKVEVVDRIGLVKAILVNEKGWLDGAGDPRSFDDVEGY